MQINDSRLFKATRRTIRAELTLIIVIVISFSWSAYALYKLVVSNTDSSLFGINFSLASSAPAKQINTQTGSFNLTKEPPTTSSDHHEAPGSSVDKHRERWQHHWTTSGLETTPSHPVSDNLSEQLAIYKKQILKELLARQRRLLIDDANDAAGLLSNGLRRENSNVGGHKSPSLVPLPVPAVNLNQYEFAQRLPAPLEASIDNLQKWRGSYNLPSSLNYTFDTRVQIQPQQRPYQGANSSIDLLNDRLPLGSNNAHSIVKLSHNHLPKNHLVHLTDGPSLMQLAPKRPDSVVTHSRSSGREPSVLSEQNLDHEEGDYSSLSQGDNLDNDNGHQLTLTTTEAPPVPALASEENLSETTTAEPTLATVTPTTTTTTTDSPTAQQPDQETTTSDPDDGEAPAEVPNSDDQQDHDSEPSRANKSRRSGDGEAPTGPSKTAVGGENEQGDSRADDGDNSSENEDDAASMERVKNTVHAIDEEVDRMTQPSLGSVSQQDKAFDLKNIVQFDDNLSGLSVASEIMRTNLGDNSSANTNLTRPSDHHQKQGDKRKTKPLDRNSDLSLLGEPDLLVADDRAKAPISRADLDIQVPSVKPEQPRSTRLESATHSDRLNRVDKQGQRIKNDIGARILKLNASRGAASESKSATMRSPQALETKQLSSTEGSLIRRRSKRSLESNLIGQTLDMIDAKSKKTDEQIKKKKKKAKKNRRKDRSSSGQFSSRRSDDDDDNSDDGDDDDDENSEENQEEHVGGDEGVMQGGKSAASALGGQYITSNDPSLQDLLAHKQLLDALQQSQLPAPISNKPVGSAGQLDRQQQLLNSTFIGPPAAAGADQKSANQKQHSVDADREPAHTHYTIDHGLLLSPASDEEHEHHSVSKKSGKSSEKKNKKKVTVAIKKGGHKKKKHKKEEKKYVKEKKFKGAKKGKKMAKGKGGKGGKKGKKFYKDKGFKKKGFKNIYVKNEFGQKKEYFDEFRDKDFKKKWKNFDDKYKYAQMKKWQAKDVKGAKKMKDHSDKFKKYDKGKWKKKYHKHQASESSKKKKSKEKYDEF